ncbi:DNA-binding response regulator [Longirhabdus pacifica]|uniref:DNA-binding response regulator n=1 Tax=Longirhabdus pacifica TaxID=2305227 RepID=UPI001008AA09|nr:DNA-binding response regulator [Longirhabdus pacifica]
MNKKEIREALKDFHWMEKEILRLYKELDMTPTASTSQYGIEASMPKGRGNPTDKVANFVIRKDRYGSIIFKLEKKVRLINEHTESINDDRMTAVLHCILDGMSIVSISKHLQISERNVYNIRDAIVHHIHRSMQKQVNASNHKGQAVIKVKR